MPEASTQGQPGADQTNGGQPGAQGSQPAAAATPAEKPAAAAATAPEKYGDFKLPEGFKFSEAELTEIHKSAKGRNFTQEQAQAYVDEKVADRKSVVDAIQKSHVEQLDAWKKAASTDKEYGGEQLAANLAIAEKALAEHGTDALKEVLTKSGLANHPEVVRFFYRVGKLLSEDTPPKGKGEQEAAKSATFHYDKSQHA